MSGESCDLIHFHNKNLAYETDAAEKGVECMKHLLGTYAHRLAPSPSLLQLPDLSKLAAHKAVSACGNI